MRRVIMLIVQMLLEILAGRLAGNHNATRLGR